MADYETRPATIDDAEAIAEVLNAAEREFSSERPWLASASDVRDFFRYIGDAERNAWVVSTGGGVAATGAVMARGEHANAFVRTHPEHTGRGLASRLLDAAEARATDLIDVRPLAIHADTLAANERARALLDARGYRTVRHHFEMGIDLADVPDPTWPDGVALEAFRSETARELHEVHMDVFSEEWGFAPTDFETWSKMRIEAERFDPSLWFIARDRDGIAGYILCSIRPSGGFVENVGVARHSRGRGLGAALLQHAFAELARRGETHASLGVDSANPTGATRLYERVGMRVIVQSDTYEKQLAS